MRASMISLLAVACVAALCAPASAWKQDQFLVTFWCPPPATEVNLSAVAAEGYNLTWASVDKLDLVAKHGLKALLQDPLLAPSTLDNPVAKRKLEALIERVKSHPALEGYYLTDEPGSGAFPGLGRLTAFLKEHDPKRLAYINLFPTYANERQLGVSADEAERHKVGLPLKFAGIGNYKKTTLAYKEHLRQYIQTVKPGIISYDHYHFLKGGVDGAQYFLNLGLIREASQSAGLPFLNIIQASTIERSWRLVDKRELRWQVYTTLAYGGRGISYFLYWGPASYGGFYQDGKQTPLAMDAAGINSELKTVGQEMMKLKSIGVYHTAPVPVGGTPMPPDAQFQITGGGQFVTGFFSDAGKTDTFMIVNRNYKKASTAKIQLPKYVYALKAFNRKSGKWQTYASIGSTGLARIIIQPGDGRLMKMISK